MAYSEFPHALYAENPDMREMIHLYKKVDEEYSALLAEVGNLKTELATYQQFVNNSVQPTVNKAVGIATYELRSRITLLEANMKTTGQNLQNAISKEIAERKKADCTLMRLINDLCDNVAEWKKEYTTMLNSLPDSWRADIENAKVYLMGRDAYYHKQTLKMIKTLQEEIEDIPENSLIVFNPIRQKTDTANNTFADLYDYAINWGGFTVEEWDNSTYITVDYWNRLGISCLDFYTHGKYLCNYYYDYNHVFDPISGQYVTLQTAIYSICNVMKVGGISAEEYDKKELTAENYDSAEVKAYCYDWHGKEMLENVQSGN